MSSEAFEEWYDKNHWAMLSTPKEDVELIWQAAQADAFERAAKVCHEKYMALTHGVDRTDPTDDWECGAKSDVAKELREDIRALAKEVT